MIAAFVSPRLDTTLDPVHERGLFFYKGHHESASCL